MKKFDKIVDLEKLYQIEQTKRDKKIDRYINATYAFGTRYYGEDKQLERDLAFMSKKYEQGGGWSDGKKHAFKELFKRIFKD